MESQEDRISFFNANLLYLGVMVLFVSVGYVAQKWDFNYGVLITEFLLVALPAIIYVKVTGASVKRELRFNSLSLTDMLLVAVAFVSAYFVAVFLNLIGEILVSTAGELIIPDIPFASDPAEYLVLLLVIAGSAGICEEILFRGFILRAYERFGMWTGIIITALLFSMLHLNVQNLLAPFFLGLVLGYVVYKTNSIFAGMLGHFINNAISVTWGYVIMSLPLYEAMKPEQLQEGVTTESLIGAAFLFALVLPFAGGILAICLKAINDRHPEAVAGRGGASLAGKLKSIRLSWPLLFSLLIFIGMVTAEIYLIINGRPIINI
ncbi:MAG TPA: type II CAAX endopeptidase family protein [Clostridia bacterium]|nr:type II CAAX endopeptidase family protein [Clostridia bacterium]